jgi:polyisoprenoid-binding protein YceI
LQRLQQSQKIFAHDVQFSIDEIRKSQNDVHLDVFQEEISISQRKINISQKEINISQKEINDSREKFTISQKSVEQEEKIRVLQRLLNKKNFSKLSQNEEIVKNEAHLDSQIENNLSRKNITFVAKNFASSEFVYRVAYINK